MPAKTEGRAGLEPALSWVTAGSIVRLCYLPMGISFFFMIISCGRGGIEAAYPGCISLDLDRILSHAHAAFSLGYSRCNSQ